MTMAAAGPIGTLPADARSVHSAPARRHLLSCRAPMTTTVRSYCLRLLQSGDLATKLTPPRAPGGSRLDDSEPGPAVHIEAPARDPALQLHKGAGRLPPLS